MILAAAFSGEICDIHLWQAGPVRVIKRHRGMSAPCQLYPRKQTFTCSVGMSEKCQKATLLPLAHLDIPRFLQRGFKRAGITE